MSCSPDSSSVMTMASVGQTRAPRKMVSGSSVTIVLTQATPSVESSKVPGASSQQAPSPIQSSTNTLIFNFCGDICRLFLDNTTAVSYTHLRAHETDSYLV